MELPEKLPHLADLLAPVLGADKIIVDHEVTKLTTAGDNYGSLMLAVKVSVHSKNKNNETLDVVAKIPPPNEFMQKMFNTPVTFRNEIVFYQNILPLLKKFRLEQGHIDDFNCFPAFYGARLSLKSNDNVDNDAVLLLENLKIAGFEVVERTIGFDLATAEDILKNFAKFHATPLAMKVLKPTQFQEEIKKPFFKEFKIFQLDEAIQKGVIEKIVSMIGTVENLKPLTDKVRETLEANRIPFLCQAKNSTHREPFSTIIHVDAWVNNFMIKFAEGKPIESKLIDFQLYEYGSPARDVLFFLLSSVQIPVVEQHFDALLEFYHHHFIENLKSLNCSNKDLEAFSFENFEEELEFVAKNYELLKCMMILEVLFAAKEDIKEGFGESDIAALRTELAGGIVQRAALIVKEFVRKKWII